MAGFLDRLLSGRYPTLEALWKDDFSRLVDEVFKTPEPDVFEDEFDDELTVERLSEVVEEANETITRLSGELDRVRAELLEERSRLESLNRELAVAKAERKSLLFKLDAVKHALAT